MILVDTSVWVNHLRRGNRRLTALLNESRVWCHPFVVGELACGRLRNRREVIDLLGALPQAPIPTHEEVLAFVDTRELFGRGVGWVDVHLLASAALAGTARVWTADRRLARVAAELDLVFE